MLSVETSPFPVADKEGVRGGEKNNPLRASGFEPKEKLIL
jgi:hypothetical protein